MGELLQNTGSPEILGGRRLAAVMASVFVSGQLMFVGTTTTVYITVFKVPGNAVGVIVVN